jgi:Lon protease-like protein
MVNHCLNNDLMMGVCHIQKVLHQVKEKKTLQEALSSNQDTYKPHDIFSIGKVELLETFPDGRMKITVDMLERVKLEREVQTLPFSIVEVSEYPDLAEADEAVLVDQFKEKIITRIKALFSENQAVINYFDSSEITRMPADVFSYVVFTVIRLDPDNQQEILELRTPKSRMETLLKILNESSI